MKLSNHLYYLLAVITGIAGSLLVALSLKHGVGVTPDSVAYIRAAIEFRNGNGIESLPNHWPPLYTLALSVAGLFHPDQLLATKLFQSALFGINIILIPALSIPKSGNSNMVKLLLSLFLLTSPQFFAIHQMAWSEPLFLALCFAGLAILKASLNHRIWYYSAMLLGLATITRYAGVYFILVALLWVAYFTQGSLFRRVRVSATYLIIALSPLMINSVLNATIKGSSTNRSLEFHPATFEHLASLFDLLRGWFTPFNQSYLGFGLLAVVAFIASTQLIALVKIHKQTELKQRPFKCWPAYMIIVAVGYIGFILFSISFIDAYTPISERIFIPTFVALWISLSSMMFKQSKVASKAVILIFVTIASSNFAQTSAAISHSIQYGIGYLAAGNEKAPLLSAAKKVANGRKIYTNGEDFLYIHLGLNAYQFPKSYSPASLKKNADFQKELAQISEEIQNGEAIAVFFANFRWRKYYPTPQDLYDVSKVLPIYSQRDGIILGFTETAK